MKLTIFSSPILATIPPEQIAAYDAQYYNCLRWANGDRIADPAKELLQRVKNRKAKADNIIEINGPSGTGKTTLCLQFLSMLDSKVWTKFVLLRAKDIGTKEFLSDYVQTMMQPKGVKTVYIIDDKLDSEFWNDLTALTDSIYSKIGGNDCLFVVLSTGGLTPSIRSGRLLDRLTLHPLPAIVAGRMVAARGGDPNRARREMTLAEVYSTIGNENE